MYRSKFGHSIEALIEDAETISRHNLNLLGSDTYHWGNPIDWYLDRVSGYRWPKKLFWELKRHGTDQ